MKTCFYSKSKNYVLGLLLMALACQFSLHSSESAKGKLDNWFTSCPYIGLVAKEVKYGPVKLSKFDMDNNGRLVIAKSGEALKCSVNYRIDSSQMDSWHMHHVIVGIQGQDIQTCITHTIGVWDKKGTAHFEINAPTEKGVYEVRFVYEQGLLCADAIERWEADASSKTTVGIIIVE